VTCGFILSVLGCTLNGVIATESPAADPKPMVRPAWVRPDLSEVRSALGIVRGQLERTEAPASRGALYALMWALDLPDHEVTPVLRLQRERTLDVAVVEIEAGGALFVGDPYPDPAWWVERRTDPSRTMPRSLWDEIVVTGMWREFVSGAANALGWLVGAQERATCKAPDRDGAGKRFSDRDRQIMRFRLFRLDYPDEVVRRMLEAPGVDIHNL
jgi:hypothetical protein